MTPDPSSSSPRAARAEAPVAIAVTGMGVLTPLGDSVTSLLESLQAGRRSVQPAPEPELAGVLESRIADFDAVRYANVRGMRIYNRTTRLGISAVRLALTDAGLAEAGAGAGATSAPGAVRSEELGVIVASTFGHLDTLMEYDRSLATDGIQRTNPALMPLGLPSAPGAAIALSFVAKAFSITLADEGASSLDAVALGARLLADGRARVCVVVGAFAPFLELTLAAMRSGILAKSGHLRVFDRGRAGTAFGEGAAALVLEREADARLRGAPIKGLVVGQASTFASRTAASGAAATGGAANGSTEGAADGGAAAISRACVLALGTARIDPSQLGVVSSGANGSVAGDLAEALALREALGASAGHTPVIAIKGNLGEGLDAGGLLQAIVALSALRSGQAPPGLPPILELAEPEVPGLRYARAESGSSARGGGVKGRHALVTATSSTGACSALILAVPTVHGE